MLVVLLALAFLLPAASYAQVVGAATGFAKGVTGGGSATPAVPADINQSVLPSSSMRYGAGKLTTVIKAEDMAHGLDCACHHAGQGVQLHRYF